MFTSSVIRKLSRSEEMFAQTHSFVGLAAEVRGPIDLDALSTAFDALLEAHPVLGGHLECDDAGRYQIAVDDLEHPGIDVVELADPQEAEPPVRLDQRDSLISLRVLIRDGQPQPTLYIHHSLADGHHEFALIEELFGAYSTLVTTGGLGAGETAPAPDSLETILAERNITKQRRSGLERFMPAMFAYDLPPSRRAAGAETNAASPQRVPMSYCRLSEQETRAVVDFGRAHKLSLNAMMASVILLAEWELRGRTSIPVPYLYPVDLRYVLSPPVSATACTNPVGVATYLAHIDDSTGVIGLAREIAATLKADLAEGVIQQSLLHFSPQYVGNPPGLPDVVMVTDNGPVPPLPTPPGLEVVATHGELFFAVNAGIDMYSTKIFNGQLMIEYHTHAPEPQRATTAIAALLRGLADQKRTPDGE
ncbi:acyltransferase [Mycolicibacillus parakoreensis]|uniref:Phthiocerol/phthiodiolone dimycocerosyl transferase n=1 Tax=Mycolicibacillus parakoreensis TaxID=1069221 RepID=A0ABY3TZA8_9MYCO|nr:acyltransferase [Mycolicibacillus parakoreensis]MCV7317280.1 acyltransferase [Mycolicibacillus parakoreensis]ULN51675.1 acyltransferase [Mycolicibacillus parakoreensis]